MSGSRAGEERAIAYVAAHGDALARARADVLAGRAAAERVLAEVRDEDAQGPLARILHLLGVCDDHHMLRAPLAERACATLVRAQAADGSWSDATLGAAQDAVYATGMLAGYLAKMRCARPETLDAAGAFLASRWSPDLVQGARWENLAACAHYFANALHERADEVLQWCGRELERGFRTRAFDAVRTARVFAYCDAHAVPGAQLDAQELVVALWTEQRADGCWAPSHAIAPAQRVACTIDALIALRHLGGASRARRPTAARGAPARG
ncbi:MAG: hypothetical protein OEM49_07435 [Myxococcales bacterium]|nr:hypothetical protein [Myxococcales bacterium]MDH5306191.1 hypothetical protein [Myxococcales bacterium]MDH5566031.1 hypothetical protein [Myxococcales bacterium]